MLLFWWNPLIPSWNLDEVCTYNHMPLIKFIFYTNY